MAEAVGDLALLTFPVTEQTLCRDVYDRFSNDPDLLALPVIRCDQPVGLVNREDFLVSLADRFGRALYEGKAITTLMESEPLIVESHNSVDFVSQYVATEKPSALLKGFIITTKGRYTGVVSGLRLLQATVSRLQQQTIALELARKTEEEANRTKSTFLATVSHELRTPLNAIIGFANFILTDPYGPVTPVRYRNYIHDIATSGEHLLKLINDILDMSRVEAGRLELRYSLIDPIEVMQSTLRMMKPQIDRSQHQVTLDVDPGLPEISADERAIKQILVNLVSNAVKFTPSGGRIVLRASSKTDDTIQIEVRDNGIGIAPEKIAFVKTPFGQVDSSLSRQYDGTGLGLPLVEAFVDAHGGTFTLESTLGQGTTAIVVLPILQAEDMMPLQKALRV